MLGKGSLLVELLESISHCPDLPCPDPLKRDQVQC